MRFPRPRLSVRMMIGLVAACALLVSGWKAYLDPVRLWKAAIRAESPETRRSGVADAVNGRIPGIDPDMAIAELIRLTRDEQLDRMVQETAVNGLLSAHLRGQAVIPPLIKVIRGDQPGHLTVSLLSQFVDLLGKDDPARTDAVAAFVGALKHPDRRVRRRSAHCLAWLGEGNVAVPTLIEALEVPGLAADERAQLIESLQRSGPKAKGALPAIRGIAEDTSIDEGDGVGRVGLQGKAGTQLRAARFLHAFGETGRAVETLRRLAKDRDSIVALAARSDLSSIESTTPTAGTEASP